MIDEFIQEKQIPSYRAKQFNKHFYQEFVESFDDLSTWPKELRTELTEKFDFSSLDLEKEFVSEKGDTTKVLFKRKKDGQRIETVLMEHKDGRKTVCVSCMVGCPVNCTFCATGKMGFGGNLTANEIVDQVLYFSRKLAKSNEKVSNIVFMGMGEPMLNLDNVIDSIDIFTNPKKMGLSQRRITISTSGYVPQLKTFIDRGFRGRLAISLHAPNQELRERLMPVAKIFSLNQLMNLIDEYTKLNNKRVSYEYVMISGVNDQPEHARQLVKLFRKRYLISILFLIILSVKEILDVALLSS
jgi:23S rRNA (adenine2503-C2)-methyltransferase